jgi:uncharacterized membrane protein
MLTRRHEDEGSITVLVIGYTAIALVLIVVGVDVSKVFLAQRALSSAADSAALAAAQGVDRAQIYNGAALQCGARLPLDPGRAGTLAAQSLDDARPTLGHSVAELAAPQTAVESGTVSVRLTGAVHVPFGKVLSWLDPSRPDGLVHISETAHARSPVGGAAGC